MRLKETDNSLEMVGLDGAADFGIDPENWGMAIKKFYDYSDPTGSIVREVTSNAIDGLDEAKAFRDLDIATLIEEGWAKEVYKDVYKRMMGGRNRPHPIVGLADTEEMIRHGEDVRSFEAVKELAEIRAKESWYKEVEELQKQFATWQETPVRVAIEETTEDDFSAPSYTFTVTDQGIGLSPLRVRDIYSKFFSSTKRETSRQMGAFGLGAKSPLGYADSFMLDSWYNGKHYQYIIFRGTAAPKIEVIDVTETDLPNGVKVSVPIEASDVDKFHAAVGKQLAYFDRVVFDNVGMTQDFSIYKAKTFVYRNPPPSAEVHLCLGRVFYPLDLATLGYSPYGTDYPRVPMGLRFGVDEVGADNEPGKISILWNRESIQYNDETIKAIRKKLEESREELQEIWDASTSDIGSLEEYMEVLESPKSSLEVGEGVVMTGLNTMIKVKKTYLKYSGLKQIPNHDLFFTWKPFRSVENGKTSSVKSSLPPLKQIFKNRDRVDLYRAYSGTAPSNKKNAYLLWEEKPSFYILKKNTDITDEEVCRLFGYQDYNPPSEDEKILINGFLDEIDDYIYEITESYDAVEPSNAYEQFLKDEKKKVRAAKEEKMKRGVHEFPIKRIRHDDGNSSYSHTSYNWLMETMTVNRAADSTALVVYGFQEEDQLLKTAASCMFQSPTFYNNDYSGAASGKLNGLRAEILKIGRSSEEFFMDNPRAMHVNEFMTQSKVVKRYVTAVIMKGRLPSNYHILSNDTIKVVEPRLYKYIQILYRYIAKATNNSHSGVNPVHRVNGFTDDLLKQYAKMDVKRRQLITLSRKRKTRLPIPEEVYDSSILDVYKKVMVYLTMYPLLLELRYPGVHTMDVTPETQAAFESSVREYLSLRRVTNPELLIRLKKERQKV